MLILTTKDIKYMHDMHPIAGNTILEVEKKNPTEYRVTRGEYKRIVIQSSDCVLYGQEPTIYPEINQELLQRREEVKQLMIERDGLMDKLGICQDWNRKASQRYTEDCNKHVQLENRLKSDIKALKDQLALPWNKPEKVALPKEVAEAIQSFRDDGQDMDYIINRLSDPRSVVTDRLKGIRSFADKNGYTLISALVNGYTIEEPEQTDEDKFKKGFHHLYQRISVEDSSLNSEKRRAKLVDHLNTLAKEIYSKS